MIFDVALSRELKQKQLEADLVVVGGGLAGVCAAITAAREKLRVVLVQDRPVLGGNASSEVRLWALGATSHMGNNNRWAREGGVIDEILVENIYRNPEGNANLVDALLLDKVIAEPGITLLLDTAVYEVEKKDDHRIGRVAALCSQSNIRYDITAPLFCDASGDGILGWLSGASFRVGAESACEFDEAFAPTEAYGGLLGHSMFFYSRDTGKPVKFVPPDFALKDITDIPRYRNLKANDSGCQLWWLEYGGRLDTVHDTQRIKHELQRVIYGVWNYIKNSGKFPEAENLTLEWVGSVPGKRESRRFEGDYMLSQRDVIEQHCFDDAVAFGGWAIDLHPADGVYSQLDGCTQWHSKGVYQIPYRTMYSRDIPNLFLAGRIISVTHVALGSTRVMATTAHSAQAVGMAAVLCVEHNVEPRTIAGFPYVQELQRRLLRSGQYIPGLELDDPDDLAQSATAEASSELKLSVLHPDGGFSHLDRPRAMLLPCRAGAVPEMTFYLSAERDCEVEFQLRVSSIAGNYTPDVILESQSIPISAGDKSPVKISFASKIDFDQYIFVALMRADGVRVLTSAERISGVLSLSYCANTAVSRSATQEPPPGIGVERFEFWLPQRRPGGRNFAMKIAKPIDLFSADEVRGGFQRPVNRPNCWVATLDDPEPQLTLRWERPVQITSVILFFDTDFDHAMESVQMGHPEREMPFCVKNFDLIDAGGKVVYSCRDNHSTRHVAKFTEHLLTSALTVRVLETHGARAAIFRVMVF
ncbi:MAG: FAD-dependent oxidoreductase [Kiritimatiellae bacterium]|nr:FAD-dependent oxidoreductase [Kiritimatiellia bacterium]